MRRMTGRSIYRAATLTAVEQPVREMVQTDETEKYLTRGRKGGR